LYWDKLTYPGNKNVDGYIVKLLSSFSDIILIKNEDGDKVKRKANDNLK
jgi:hypothetical protein